jgi:plastocyanin
MKNKIFIFSVTIVTLAFIVSGCSLYNTKTKPLEKPDMPSIDTTVPTTTTEEQNSLSDVTIPTVNVAISGFAFNPANLTIERGTKVTWTNNDQVLHSIKSESFNSDLFGNGESYSMTFNDAGTFNYECGPHPVMTGQLIVK